MISQIFNDDVFKILSLFAVSPGSRHNRKEMKEKTRLNNIPLDNALLKLLSSGIVKKEGNYYSINFENEDTKSTLSIASKQYKKLKELPFDVYFIILDLVLAISTLKGIEAYLFGSYSKLIYKEGSDVDIAILLSKDINRKAMEKRIRKMENVYKKNIEVHYFDKKSFYKSKKDPLVKEIVKNGVRLV